MNRVADPYFNGAPDLAVEVVSPSNRAAHLLEKVAQYLGAGSQAVMVVYIEKRCIAMYWADNRIELLRRGERVTLTSVLPGFEVEVDHIFD